MATFEGIRDRVRMELGDRAEQFQSQMPGDGTTVTFDLPVGLLSVTGLRVYKIEDNLLTTLTSPADYIMDFTYGTITLTSILPEESTLFVEGQNWTLFSDAEIDILVKDAVAFHCHNATIAERYKDDHGFIKYRSSEKDLANLPEIEEPLIAILATIEALWALTNDGSTDIDILSAEGTNVPRGQRYAQMRSQIEALTDKYKTYAAQLNVGLFRVEVSTLRRRSLTTGRLVPVFADREYDDASLPQRLLPEINAPDKDESGIPSPVYGAYWWGM